MDNAQWETILRSVSAFRSFRWLNEAETTPMAIAQFLILDRRMPRSLAFCYSKISGNLRYLAQNHVGELPCLEMAQEAYARLDNCEIESIFDEGLHEFLEASIGGTARLASQIQQDFRFTR